MCLRVTGCASVSYMVLCPGVMAVLRRICVCVYEKVLKLLWFNNWYNIFVFK